MTMERVIAVMIGTVEHGKKYMFVKVDNATGEIELVGKGHENEATQFDTFEAAAEWKDSYAGAVIGKALACMEQEHESVDFVNVYIGKFTPAQEV